MCVKFRLKSDEERTHEGERKKRLEEEETEKIQYVLYTLAWKL